MKPKKTVKRLAKIEVLLTKIKQQLPERKDGLGEMLDSAKTAVERARQVVISQLSARVSRKPPVKAKTARQGRLTEAGRKRISRAARKRWALARQKGINAVTGRPLRKTA